MTADTRLSMHAKGWRLMVDEAGSIIKGEEKVGQNPLRDPAFVRLSADIGLCMNLPQGVEIALFLRTPGFRNVVLSDDGLPTAFEAGRLLVDVARLRMSDDDATALAYNILLSIAQSGIVDVDAFDANVATVRAVIVEADTVRGEK